MGYWDCFFLIIMFLRPVLRNKHFLRPVSKNWFLWDRSYYMKTGHLDLRPVARKPAHMVTVPQAHITTFVAITLFPGVNNASFNSVPGMGPRGKFPLVLNICSEAPVPSSDARSSRAMVNLCVGQTDLVADNPVWWGPSLGFFKSQWINVFV